MKKSHFAYQLPDQLIADYPSVNRSDSRLLVYTRSDECITDARFIDILDYLKPNDLLVFNNTQVIPARLIGQKKTGGKVEIFVERVLNQYYAKVMLKANRPIKLGTEIWLDSEKSIHIEARQGMFYLLHSIGTPLSELLEVFGAIPLPPYIDRSPAEIDENRYQTVYAKVPGAVAAPTAGLHFDQALLEKIKNKGVHCAYVTLHVGAGTFQPVKTERIEEHVMHREWLEVDQCVCDQVLQTKKRGGRVIAVGTTAVRSLETAAQSGLLEPYRGDTGIFIYPGYQFRIIDGLITNFHLPESTLLMLVSALAGRENILNTYQHAINEEYRFFSYGDAMFII